MNSTEAIALLKNHVKKENLINHCLATAVIMKGLAKNLGEDKEKWEIIGILHDIDFEEIEEDMNLHGERGYSILLEAGVDEEIAEIIRRHNYEKFGDFETQVDVALTAADNISGLVIACAMVKGGKLSEVTGKTVKKKFKEKSFAAGCNRERIKKIESLMDRDEFYRISVDSLNGIKDVLGLG